MSGIRTHTEMLTTAKAVPCEVSECSKACSGQCTRGHPCYILLRSDYAPSVSRDFDWGWIWKPWTKLFGRGHFTTLSHPSCGTVAAHRSSQIYSKEEQSMEPRTWETCGLLRKRTWTWFKVDTGGFRGSSCIFSEISVIKRNLVLFLSTLSGLFCRISLHI